MILRPIVQYDLQLSLQTPGSPLWILLAEDDNDLRDVLVEFLESEGYRVTAVGSGAEVQEVLASAASAEDPRVPDVLLTDYRMPAPNGMSLLQAAKFEGWPMRVILMSAYVSSEMRHDVQRMQAKLLYKPFELEQLINVLEESVAPDVSVM